MDAGSIISLILSVITAIGTTCALLIRTRSRARSKEAMARAKEHRATRRLKVAERDQLMKEYGLLLAGLREELNRSQANQATTLEFVMSRANMELAKLQEEGYSDFEPRPGKLTMAKEALSPIRDDLLKLYAGFSHLPRRDRDDAAILEIVRRHNPFIIKALCEPYGLIRGACLLIALAVAKNGAGHEHAAG